MDPLYSFYQALDSERLLKEHAPSLLADAREVLTKNPHAKVAGMITMPDAPDAAAIRAFLGKVAGREVPPGLLVGIVPRQAIEPTLRARAGTDHWQEQGWHRQSILPVIVTTRDGMRFGFFSIATGRTEM